MECEDTTVFVWSECAVIVEEPGSSNRGHRIVLFPRKGNENAECDDFLVFFTF